MRPVLKDLERDLKKDYAPGSFKTILPEEGHKTVSAIVFPGRLLTLQLSSFDGVRSH